MNKRIPGANQGHPKSGKPRILLGGIHVVLMLGAMLLILNLLMGYGIFLSPQGILGFRQQSRHVEELEAKILKVKTENQKLFNKLQALKNSPKARERLIREQLGWVRENELVIEFLPPVTNHP